VTYRSQQHELYSNTEKDKEKGYETYRWKKLPCLCIPKS